MSTTVKIFRSTETGAPALSGQAGKLIDVLNACLVDGYGGGTATSITRSGSTATLTFTAHTFSAGDVVAISGAEQSEYNGEFVISNITADTFGFTVTGEPTTPATGTIAFKKAPAGWTKPYTGTNLAAYRQGAGSQMYLRVDDSNAQYPRVLGYHAMTDISSGANGFPTDAQISGGLYLYKSSAASSATRPWQIVANDRFYHLMVDRAADGSTCDYIFFGDIVSYAPDDAYAAMIVGGTTTATGSWSTTLAASVATVTTGNYIAAAHNGVGGSLQVGKHTDTVKAGSPGDIGRLGTNPLLYPNGPDGGLVLAPVWVHETTRHLRGHVPGLWASCHSGRPLGHGDVFEGSGALAGRKFIAWNCWRPTGTADAQVIIETSNTWYS